MTVGGGGASSGAAAAKKAANARIDRAFAEWPHSESAGDLDSDTLDAIVARGVASPVGGQRVHGKPLTADLLAPLFPETAGPATRLRRRTLAPGELENPSAPALEAHAPEARRSGSGRPPPMPAQYDPPPASGRVSYPPPPVSGQQVTAERRDFGSRPSYPAYSTHAGQHMFGASLPSGATPVERISDLPLSSSQSNPMARLDSGIRLPSSRASTPPSPLSSSMAAAPPEQTVPMLAPRAPLSMPTLPPIPSVPNAPVSEPLDLVRARAGNGALSNVSSGAPWLVVVGAAVGAIVVAGAWALSHRNVQTDAMDSAGIARIVGGSTSTHETARPVMPTKEALRGVNPSALPIASDTAAVAYRSGSSSSSSTGVSAPRSASHAQEPSAESSPAAAPPSQASHSLAEPASQPSDDDDKVAQKAKAAPHVTDPPAVVAAPPQPSTPDTPLLAAIKASAAAAAKKEEEATGAQTKPDDAPAQGPTSPASPALGTVAAHPSPGAAYAAVRKVLSSARACAPDGAGVTYATITFDSSGAVHGIDITGAAAGAPAEACIRQAFQPARVAPFSDATFALPVTVRPL